MQIAIPRATLVKALARVQGILKRDGHNPILGCVLLTARADRLTMSASDTMVTLVAEYPVTVVREGSLCVNGQTLFQIVKALPEGDITVQTSGSSRLRVSTGTSTSNLNVLPAEDFPPINPGDPTRGTMTLTGGSLARLIDLTHFAISTDENRYGLNGAHLEEVKGPKGEKLVRMVATDGSRLAWGDVPFNGTVGLERKTLLSLKSLIELRKVIDDADSTWTVSFLRHAVTYSTDGLRLIARSIDGDFPDYLQVLPSGYQRRVKISRRPFEEALKRISLFANDKNHSTSFAFEAGQIVLRAENLDTGDGCEEVTVDFEGEPITTGFNLRYFQDILGPTKGDLTLELNGELDPCIVRVEDESDFFGVIMPMRLN